MSGLTKKAWSRVFPHSTCYVWCPNNKANGHWKHFKYEGCVFCYAWSSACNALPKFL